MLLGRDVLLAAGEAAWRDATAGRGRVLLLSGEAGIGKTALARALAGRARDDGGVIRWAAGWEGANVALGIWADVLRRPGGDECAAVVAHLTAAGERTPDGTVERVRVQLFNEVADALGACGEAAPQLVVLDDLQWADETSFALLRAVAARAPLMRLLVVGTCRDDEAGAFALPTPGGAVDHLTLDGLGAADVARVLAEVLRRPPSDHEAQAVHAQTAGNPLFVTQIARLVAAGGELDSVPRGVRDVLARRLARLPHDTHDVLGAAAVLGVEFSPALVAALLERDELDVLDALDHAATARLAGPGHGLPARWSFAHGLVRAVRYEELGSAAAAELHRRAAVLLAAEDATPAAVVAAHAARGRFARDDPRHAAFALAAADEAASRLAVDAASAFYEQAVAAAPPSREGRRLAAAGWRGVGAMRLRLGAPGAARDAFDRAASIARAIADGDGLAETALAFGAGLGGFEVPLRDHRQITLLEEAQAALVESSRLLPWVLARLSVALSFVGSDERRIRLADDAARLARVHDDDRALSAALAAGCDARAGPSHTDDRAVAAGEIIRIGHRLRDERVELLGRRFMLVVLAERCDVAGMDDEIDAFESVAARLGDPLYLWYAPLWRSMRALNMGAFDRAGALCAEAQRIGAEAGSANAALLTHVQRLYLGLASGATAELEAEIRALGVELRGLGLVNGTPMFAYTDHLLGRPGMRDRTIQLVSEIDRLDVDAEWLSALAPLADLVFIFELREQAALVYERMAPFSGAGIVEGIAAVHRGPSDRWLMLAAATMGDATRTVEHLDHALALSAAFGSQTLADTRAAGAAALLRVDARRFAARVRSLQGPVSTAAATADRDGVASLRREGDVWAFTWAGRTVRVRHAKGVADLAVLLARPGRDVHVRELAPADAVTATASRAEPVIDQRAVDSYRRRLRELEVELDDADRCADLVRSSKLSAERDALVDELSRAFGVGGRARRTAGDPDERLRKAVSARVRAVIERLEAEQPALGRHLRNSIRTGFWCSYRPEQPVSWRIEH